MPALNFDEVLHQMVDAARVSVGEDWQSVAGDVQASLETLARVGVQISVDYAKQTITEDQAERRMRAVQRGIEIVLRSAQGRVRIMLEKAINAAIDVLRDAIKTATNGWVVL